MCACILFANDAIYLGSSTVTKQKRAHIQPEIVDGATPLLWIPSPKGTLSHTPERSESELPESITCCKILDKILHKMF